jgi:uncharacterized circularly permuted ATP-grasp superfamily protein/uncharacterized alpha-E superfamily protein
MAPQPTDLFRHYVPPRATYDEMFERPGEPRRHWRNFIAELNRLGNDEYARRWEQSQQVVHENGIAHSAYGDPKDKPRPWELDALPLLIPQSEWQTVRAGLQQRAQLLERVLADLYGPQTLIEQGILPSEIIFAHPGFHRAYHDVPPAGGKWLHMYAADLARGADGRWWVLADRSEAPSGAGFALENRVVMSRMLPTVFREANIQRLAPYFMALQQSVQHLALRHRDNPRVVLLTQGPRSLNYFEDSYLARYLGYTLVEGDDLAVRNNDVMLKTLSGLLPVDVILRRPNSDACDSLELDDHGQMGSAGLLQAVRSGSVAVVNAMGSGLVESPVFMAFLPSLCERVLGEPLLLPGVATWWCGQPDSCEYVLGRIESLVVKPAFRRRGHGHEETQELSRLPADELVQRIRANPLGFVAQERTVRSSIPRWRNGSFQPSHVALRTYLATTDEGYEVMSGGLTRTSCSTDSLEMSLVGGEGSKDTWILSDVPVEQVTLLPTRGESLNVIRSTGDLPSRVADNLFWLGRHLERTDSAARLLRRIALRMTSETGSARYADLPYLIRCLADQGQIEPGYAVEGIKEQLPSLDEHLAESAYDRQQAGSLRAILDETFRVASSVRDRLSVDSWRIVVHLDGDFKRPTAGACDLTDLLNSTNELIIDLAAFGGIVTESMTRTHGYRFLEIGRRLERSLQIVTLINDCFIDIPHVSHELLESVLEIADSRMTYRSRYLATLQVPTVLDLLLTDETNPRALAYQLAALQDHVLSLPQLNGSPGYKPHQRLAMSMLHRLRMCDIEAMCDAYVIGDQQPLQSLLAEMLQQLPTLSNAISLRYLVHAGPSQQLGDLVPQPG